MGVLAWCTLLVCVLASIWVEHCEAQNGDSSANDDRYSFPSLGMYNFMAVVTSKAGVCSGAIVSQDWILSAAHCLYFMKKPIGPGDARIIAGIINYEYPNAQTKQESMSREIHIHPSFRYNVLSKYDLALIRLKDPFHMTKYVGNVSVAGDGWPQNPNDTWCMALGYGGYMSTGPTSSDLKVWNMSAEHGEDACPCALQFQSKRLICAKEQMSPLMCQGDDGGPLVCGSVVRGIGHMVWNRVTCNAAVYPTFKCTRGPERAMSSFMFLCPVADWMHSLVTVIPPRPPSCGCSTVLPNMFMTVFLTIVCFRLYLPGLSLVK